MAIGEQFHIHATHEVINQPPALKNYNVYTSDAALVEAVNREDAGWAETSLRAFGEKMGTEYFIAQGHLANTFLPVLHTHDRFGRRIDEVEFHPSYHECFRAGVEAEAHALPWNHRRPGAHVARAVKHFLLSQTEAGVCCPITMTFAAVPALRWQPEIAEEWIPRITSTQYDPRIVPAPDKTGCTMGMAMTEKQGGSDVRANTTRAVPLGAEGPGREYFLTGHKYFVSGAMGDAFLALACTERGLSCFIVPRWLPDGARNRLYIMRLKEKLGNRSNATSEMEFCDTWARMVGEEGHGVRTIMEMVTHTRLDCTIGTAAIMRQSLAQALHHTRHRSAFGRLLNEQPLMRNVLADLALESEAATALTFHLAGLYDAAAGNESRRPLARLATAISKYWVCKRAPNMVFEALECHGGDGYMDPGPMPRWYREAPVSSVWEGSGNVICLDVLKTIAREPESITMFLDELNQARDADKRLNRFISRLQDDLANPAEAETRARRIVEAMALALQASLLVRVAPSYVADAFCTARLERNAGNAYGTLPPNLELTKIIKRAMPQTD